MVRRLNAVALNGERPSHEQTRYRLERVMRLFEQAGLRPKIRQTTLDDWLDDHLDGWTESGETVVIVAEPKRQPMPAVGDTSTGSIAEWLAWIEPESAQRERFIEAAESAQRLSSENVVVFAHEDGNRVGAGRAVASNGMVGLYDIKVIDGHRRRGHGDAITRDLMMWAADRSSQVYLQVEAVNHPALALYEGHGFVEVYRYRYRSPARPSR
jgi:ribosomal protein S18 acetylase RimI-like enzyme